jgi:hypothetical protein
MQLRFLSIIYLVNYPPLRSPIAICFRYSIPIPVHCEEEPISL